MTDIGVGQTPTAEELALRELQKRFTPDKQIEFLQTTASRVLTQTGIVATVLAAGGLVAITTILTNPVSYWWMVVAVGLSTLAALLALLTQVTRLKKMRVGDLNAIQEWFERYKGWRGIFLVAATWILVAAFLAAVVAVGTALMGRTMQPTFDATVSVIPGEDPAPDTYSVRANFTVPPAGGADQLALIIKSRGHSVASTRKGATGDAPITVTLEATGVNSSDDLTVSGESDAWMCTAKISDSVVTESTCQPKS